MPTPTKGPRLGGGPAHERLILANLATSLFEHGRITTTETKAKRLRPFAERLVTFAKRGDLASRRRASRVIRDRSVVHTLFAEIGPRYENRPGGYTRITKVGPRKGDNAPMAVIELVEALTVQQEAVGEAEAATKRTAGERKPAKKTAKKAEKRTEKKAEKKPAKVADEEPEKRTAEKAEEKPEKPAEKAERRTEAKAEEPAAEEASGGDTPDAEAPDAGRNDS